MRHIIYVKERNFYEKLFVSSLEYIDLGSVYNVMVEGYGCGFEEKHVICVLQHVFLGLKGIEKFQKNHGSLKFV